MTKSLRPGGGAREQDEQRLEHDAENRGRWRRIPATLVVQHDEAGAEIVRVLKHLGQAWHLAISD